MPFMMVYEKNMQVGKMQFGTWPRMTALAVIPICGVLSLLPFVTAAEALAMGLVIAFFLENPYPTSRYTHRLLTLSVIGLGAGMDLETVARVGLQGLGYTVLSIVGVCVLGFLLMRLFKVEEETGLLITIGTAICGGSAIAAVTPVLRARPQAVSVALGTVFILNSVALVLFPPIGHLFHLSQRAFGLWAALAIHDTSSVVGATVSYGAQAAAIGTTIKLARALWIVPVTFLLSQWKRAESGPVASKFPWFILGFLLTAALVTWIPELKPWGQIVEFTAKRLLVLTLFFIGLGLSRSTIKQVGFRPLTLGLTLWILVSTTTLLAVSEGWIS